MILSDCSDNSRYAGINDLLHLFLAGQCTAISAVYESQGHIPGEASTETCRMRSNFTNYTACATFLHPQKITWGKMQTN